MFCIFVDDLCIIVASFFLTWPVRCLVRGQSGRSGGMSGAGVACQGPEWLVLAGRGVPGLVGTPLDPKGILP